MTNPTEYYLLSARTLDLMGRLAQAVETPDSAAIFDVVPALHDSLFWTLFGEADRGFPFAAETGAPLTILPPDAVRIGPARPINSAFLSPKDGGGANSPLVDFERAVALLFKKNPLATFAAGSKIAGDHEKHGFMLQCMARKICEGPTLPDGMVKAAPAVFAQNPFLAVKGLAQTAICFEAPKAVSGFLSLARNVVKTRGDAPLTESDFLTDPLLGAVRRAAVGLLWWGEDLERRERKIRGRTAIIKAIRSFLEKIKTPEPPKDIPSLAPGVFRQKLAAFTR